MTHGATATRFLRRAAVLVLAAAAAANLVSCGSDASGSHDDDLNAADRHALEMMHEGQETFRYDTFGDETFWGDQLRLHDAISGAANGGVGPGLTPRTALSVGLKVDSEKLSSATRRAIRDGAIDLDDPATTLTLLRRNAVVGVTGFFEPGGRLRSVGIQCALCHSTVDDTLTDGIGRRLDGWANRDLDVGAVVGLAPDLTALVTVLGVPEATIRQVLASWGPGKFDAELILDGIAMRPGGGSSATLIPPAYGLAGVNLHTWTGWGGVSHWNAFVANLEMHGQGTFLDSRLDDPVQFPVAARNGFGRVRNQPDRITPKLGALQVYQLALPVPTPPAGSFDAAAAVRGKELFEGAARCSTCHVPPLYTEPGWNMHTAAEVGIDDFQAQRAPDRRYRTTPLRGLWAHQQGGFYHDGRFPTLRAVVDHYDTFQALGLTEGQKNDLVEHLKSL
jgi:hypothetical protein